MEEWTHARSHPFLHLPSNTVSMEQTRKFHMHFRLLPCHISLHLKSITPAPMLLSKKGGKRKKRQARQGEKERVGYSPGLYAGSGKKSAYRNTRE